MAQYRELEAFAQFASDLDAQTRQAIERGKRTTEMLKQPQYAPMSVAHQVMAILAVTEGYLDEVPVERIAQWERAFGDYMTSMHDALIHDIETSKAVSDEVKEQLVKVIKEFTKDFWLKRMNKKTVQRRIRSVRNTRKITKAMELVAGAKMRKATDAVLASRPYVEALRGVVGSIAKQADVSLHPLLRKSEDRERVLVILIMSDRGLCGGYNVQMTRQMRQFLARHAEGAAVDVITIGKRAAHAARQLKLNVLEHYTELGADPKVESLRPIVRSIITGYADGTFDDVFIGYTDFQSAIRQMAVVAAFLPLSKMHEGFGSVGEHLYDEEGASEVW